MIKIPVPTWEKRLTYLIAQDGSSRHLDGFMILISDPYRWLSPALIMILFLLYVNWQSALTAILLGGLGAAVADGINTKLLKKHTDRIRPAKQFDDIRSLGIMNRGKKSFPSNHASNTMAFALGLALVYPMAGFISIPLALLVGYSRIYCGAHFPLDVLSGFFHGAVWVSIFYMLFSFLH